MLETYENEHRIYSEYRKNVADIEQKVSDGLDKAILAISSAALGFSVTIYKSDPSLFSRSCGFNLSLILFCLALLFVIISQLFASYICSKYLDNTYSIIENRLTIIDEIKSGNPNPTPETSFDDQHNLKKINRFFHFGSGIILCISIITFGFSILTIYSGDKHETTSTSQSTTETNKPESKSEREDSSSTTTSATVKTDKTDKETIGKEPTNMTEPVFIPNQAPPPTPPPTKPKK